MAVAGFVQIRESLYTPRTVPLEAILDDASVLLLHLRAYAVAHLSSFTRESTQQRGTLEAHQILPPPRRSVSSLCLLIFKAKNKKPLLNICNKHGKGAGTLICGQPRPGGREMRWQLLSTF